MLGAIVAGIIGSVDASDNQRSKDIPLGREEEHFTYNTIE
jgi:hypothetical protein